jgi:uncharacterized protein
MAPNIPNNILEEFCSKYHIKRLSLFGSVLNKKFKPNESDIDILIEFEPGKHPSLFQFAGIEIELSELYHHKVDLRTKEDLSIYFRDVVLKTAKNIFEVK